MVLIAVNQILKRNIITFWQFGSHQISLFKYLSRSVLMFSSLLQLEMFFLPGINKLNPYVITLITLWISCQINPSSAIGWINIWVNKWITENNVFKRSSIYLYLSNTVFFCLTLSHSVGIIPYLINFPSFLHLYYGSFILNYKN